MRRHFSSLVFVPALVAAAFAHSPPAWAVAQRTFVASYGLTANTAFNCSIAKPCRAFSEAIGVTNPKGEVIVLDSAGYGPVTVTKAVSLVAPSGIYAGITVSSGDGVTINAGAGDVVVLRGLSINGQGGNRGIVFQAGARLRVENCVVSGMNVAGISHNAAGGEMVVLDTIVRDNGGSGIVIGGDLPSAMLDHVRSEHNGGNGLDVAPIAGSVGILVTAIDSVFTHNEGKGIGAAALTGATLTIAVERSVMSYNGQEGLAAASNTGAVAANVTRNVFNDNGGHGLFMQGNVRAAVAENTAHRNGGHGIRLEGDTLLALLAGNSTVANLTAPGTICQSAPGAGQVRSLGNNMGDDTAFFACSFFGTGF
jgi:hypothetical protein